MGTAGFGNGGGNPGGNGVNFPRSRHGSYKGSGLGLGSGFSAFCGVLGGNSLPNIVLASVEIDERRVGRPKGRRFLYAFLQHPEFVIDKFSNKNGNNVAGDSMGSNSHNDTNNNSNTTQNDANVRMCTLRTYKEWNADMPRYEGFVKPLNYK